MVRVFMVSVHRVRAETPNIKDHAQISRFVSTFVGIKKAGLLHEGEGVGYVRGIEGGIWGIRHRDGWRSRESWEGSALAGAELAEDSTNEKSKVGSGSIVDGG